MDGSDEGSLEQRHQPAVGNGYLGTQLDSDWLFVAGVYTGEATSPSHRAALPSPVQIRVANGVVSDAGLDMKAAVYIRRSVVAEPCVPGSRGSCTASLPLHIEQRWYAHRTLKHVLVHEVEVLGDDAALRHPRPDAHGRVAPSRYCSVTRSVLPSEKWVRDRTVSVRIGPLMCYDAGALHVHGPTGGPGPLGSLVLQAAPITRGVEAGVGIESGSSVRLDTLLRGCGTVWVALFATVLQPELPGGERPVVITLSPFPSTAITVPISAASFGVTYPFTAVVITSLDLPHMSGDALKHRLLLAAAAEFEACQQLAAQGVLFALHATAWREGVWASGVEVHDGGGGLGALTNSSLYALASNIRADWPFGLGPGGLSSSGYGGRSFWDTESFSWQSMNLLFPELGAALLEYRYHRLPGARQKARSYTPSYGAAGSAAAMFPWESALTGVETCPTWAATGEKEIHVSADVSIAVAQHFATTGDAAWLRRVGWPLVRGIAEFLVRRALADTPGASVPGGAVHVNDSGSGCSQPLACPLHINGVVAPTEFYHCDDNAFTNGVAQLALRIGVFIAGVLNVTDSGMCALHCSDVARPEALPVAWESVAARLVMPFDTAAGAHLYCPDYKWGSPVQLLDVPLLALTLGYPMKSAVLRENILRYSSAFEGGAAFSYTVNALAAAELGDWQAVDRWINRLLRDFVSPPYNVWSEYPGGAGCPNFVTGAAGWLQALVFGFVHVRVAPLPGNGVRIRPALPAGLYRIVLRGVAVSGHRLIIEVTPGYVEVALQSPGGACAADDVNDCPRSTEEWEVALAAIAALGMEDASTAAEVESDWLGWLSSWGQVPPNATTVDRTELLSAIRTAQATRVPLVEAAFNPDDPSSTPYDMLTARPWLQPAGVRYPNHPSSGSCVFVSEVFTNGTLGDAVKLTLHASVRVAVSSHGLQQPVDVAVLPQLDISAGPC